MERDYFGSIAAGACVLMLAGASGNACAQAAGSFTVSTGWTHVNFTGHADELTVESIAGVPVNKVETGTSGKPQPADTLGVTLEYYVTDHLGVALTGGYPTYAHFEGRGTLSSLGEIAQAKPGAPQLILRYHFFDPQATFRPFVGLGVNYLWIYNGSITNQAFVTQSLGPGSSATVKGSSSWNPVFEVGANYKLTKRWSLTAAVSYIPASTMLTMTGTTASGIKVISKSRVGLDPILTFVGVTCAF